MPTNLEDLARQDETPGLARFLTAQGAVQDAVMRRQQMDAQRQFMQDRANLPDNPSPEQVRALGIKYATDPKTLVDLVRRQYIPITSGGLLEQNTGRIVPPFANETPQPEIIKLQQYMDTLPADHPARAAIQARINALGQPKNEASPYTNIQQDPLNPGSFVGFNKGTGKVERIPGSVAPQVNQGEGEDVLKGVNPNIAAMVRQLATGIKQPPASFAQRTPFWQEVMGLVSRYDPSYSENRFNTRKAFTIGNEGRNMTNINQAISHMGTLKDLADAMANGDIQGQNRLVNYVRTQLGHPEATNAELAAHAVSSELMRTFRGIGASDVGTKAFEDKLAVSKMSPDQINGALKLGTDLLKGRMDALQHQFEQGMNSDKFSANLLSPKAQDVLRRLGGQVTTGGGAPQAALDYLKAHPDTLPQFKAKYGYAP